MKNKIENGLSAQVEIKLMLADYYGRLGNNTIESHALARNIMGQLKREFVSEAMDSLIDKCELGRDFDASDLKDSYIIFKETLLVFKENQKPTV